MSQSKAAGSKRKAAIPNEILVTLKTPKSRKYLFSNDSVSSTPKESEIEDGTAQVKRSKRKKLRGTQNFLDIEDETTFELNSRASDNIKRRKKTLSVESVNTESSETFLQSAEKQKSTTKCKKKKRKLPTVVIDDLECLDGNGDYSKETFSHKKKKSRKQEAVDSNDSTTSEALNGEETERKVKRKRRSRESEKNNYEGETRAIKTRSSRKAKKQEPVETIEISNESEKSMENRAIIRKKKSQTTDSEFNDQTEESEVNNGTDGEVTITNKGFSSVEEDNEMSARSSGKIRKKKKRSKRSNPKHVETVEEVVKTRNSKRGHKDREIYHENEDNVNRNNKYTDQNGEDAGDHKVEVELVSSSRGFSSVDEDGEIEAKTSRKKKKRSRNKTITPKIESSRKQKEKKSNDDNKENLKNESLNDETENSEEKEDKVAINAGRRKSSDRKHEVTAIPSKNRISGDVQMGDNKENENEREKSVRESRGVTSNNYRKSCTVFNYDSTGKSEESIEDCDVHKELILTNENSSTEDDEIEAQTSERTSRKSKKSNSSVGQKGRDRDDDSNERQKSFQSIVQTVDSKENIIDREDDVIIATESRRRSSKKSDGKYETAILSKKRISEKVLKDENYGEELKIDNEDKDNEGDMNIVKGENFNDSRKSTRILNYDPAWQYGESTQVSKVHEEITFSDKSSTDYADTIEDISKGKRKRSQKSDIECNNERAKAPKISICAPPDIDENLDEILEGGNENKENINTKNESTTEDFNVSRRSGRSLSYRLTDKIGEVDGKNEVEAFTDRRNWIDKAGKVELPNISNCVTSEPSIQGRKSVTGRKRWAIMSDNKEIFPSNKNTDTPNVSLSVNEPNQRRSVRKRWSTELRKKFEAMKEENESLVDNDGVLVEYSFPNQENNENRSSGSSPNISLESPVSTQKLDHFDSPLPFSVSAHDSTDEKLDGTYTPEKSENNSFFRRSSKRLSRSLDFSDGILPLEQTITMENETSIFYSDTPESSFNSKCQTPGSILKRRGTYDLDVSVTDLSVLKSVSDSNLSDPGLLFKQDDLENVKKSVRFQHVTVRKGNSRKDDHHTPENNRFEADDLPVSVTKEKKAAPKLATGKRSVSFDQTMFSTSSLTSSTPLHSLRKNTLMKQTMKRENLSKVLNNRRSRSVETKRDKFVSRIRMPNFSKIHQKAMDRVEDIAQMTKRKAERARLLLSGQKPTANDNSTNKTQEKSTTQPKHPKQLKFNKFPQLPNHSNKETSGSLTNTIPKVLNGPAKTAISKSKIAKNQPTGPNKIANSSNKIEMESSKPLVGKSGIQDKLRNVKTNPLQFDAASKRAEEIKSIATKSKPQTDTKEERRTILKGVRGNRRFELLMKMRKK